MKVLVIGCARDGTTSASRVISDLLAVNGHPGITLHESTHLPFYEAINAWVISGDPEPARRVLEGWTHFAECSNGPAFVMPLVRQVWGPDLKVVLLVRERQAHLDSLEKRPRVNPQNWGGYFPYDAPAITRPNAVDYRDMTAEQWADMPLRVRLNYYVEKSHALVRAAAPLFSSYMEFPTEELAAPERLCRFIDPTWRPVKGQVTNQSAPVDYKTKTSEELRALERSVTPRAPDEIVHS